MMHNVRNNLFGNRKRVAYIHIPKCAGTSIVDALKTSVVSYSGRILGAAQTINLKANASAGQILGIDMMVARQAALINFLAAPRCRFVAGHVYAHPQVVASFDDWSFVTVLRNPAERFVSEFVYNAHKAQDSWAKIDKDINSYLAGPIAAASGTTLARYFSGMDHNRIMTEPALAFARSIENLKSFAVVGFLDLVDRWIEAVDLRLSLKIMLRQANSSPRRDVYDRIVSDVRLMKKIETLCEADTKIYAAAKADLLCT